jgi:3-hydroxy-3-methylglutaryl CoA synthase
MRDSFATKVLSIALMILSPSALVMAETGNTMLYAKGTVLLNGADVARSAPVTAGDKIDTAGATATTIDQNGSKVTVNPYSSLAYGDNAVNVYRGGASVETSTGMPSSAPMFRGRSSTVKIPSASGSTSTATNSRSSG